MRAPAQGVWNIVRFNWHFYAGAGVVLVIGILLSTRVPQPFGPWLVAVCLIALAGIVLSLAVSYYVYDRSPLYRLDWLNSRQDGAAFRIANIHAGFDETSRLLQHRFPGAELRVLDFYDPLKHTEVSIKRARRAHPAFPGTQRCRTDQLPLEDGSVDCVVLFLSAHEIRDAAERVRFFKEVRRVMKASGEAYVTEHLRDLPNLIAYNVGFFHFQPRRAWHRAFDQAGLVVVRALKHTPFVTTFVLRKNGNTVENRR